MNIYEKERLHVQKFITKFFDENKSRKTLKFAYKEQDSHLLIKSDYPWIFKNQKELKKFEKVMRKAGHKVKLVDAYNHDGDFTWGVRQNISNPKKPTEMTDKELIEETTKLLKRVK